MVVNHWCSRCPVEPSYNCLDRMRSPGPEPPCQGHNGPMTIAAKDSRNEDRDCRYHGTDLPTHRRAETAPFRQPADREDLPFSSGGRQAVCPPGTNISPPDGHLPLANGDPTMIPPTSPSGPGCHRPSSRRRKGTSIPRWQAAALLKSPIVGPERTDQQVESGATGWSENGRNQAQSSIQAVPCGLKVGGSAGYAPRITSI